MSKPNFSVIKRAELRTYVITHPDDKEDFYALADLLIANSSSSKYPGQMTLEEINQAVLEQIKKTRNY